MRHVKRFVRALSNVARRSHVDHELDAELTSCLEAVIEEHVARGVPRLEARRLALLEVGGLEQAKVRVRETRAGSGIERFVLDLHTAVRGLRRSPAFTCWIVTLLALGIGVNVAMFSVIDRLLVRSLPYEDAERLVQVTGSHFQAFTLFSQKGLETNPPELATSPAFEGFTMHSSGALNLGGEGAERVRAAAVMPEFWHTLRSHVQIGRVFTANDVTESETVAVLGYRFWRRKFDGDTRVLGQTLILNGQPYTVIGVLGEGVAFPNNAEVWIPAAADSVQHLILTPVALARLAPGVTAPQALDEIVRIHERAGRMPAPGRPVAIIKPLRDTLSGEARPVAALVALAGILVLLIAISNAANLLSTHVATREREFAIRSSLGASRGRLMRQVLIEALLLSAIGTMAAIIAANWTLLTLTRLLPETIHGLADIAIDARVIAGAVVASALTALLFGIAPAVSVPGRRVTDALRGVQVSVMNPVWHRLRSGLVVAQVAVALVLLSGMWTIVTAVQRFMTTDVGTRGENVVTFEFLLPLRSHRSADIRAFHERLNQELSQLPGVQKVGVTSSLLNKHVGLAVPLPPSTQPQGERMFAAYLGASPQFFAAAGVPVLAGREFDSRDEASSPRVAIVTKEYARLLGVAPTEIIGRQVPVGGSRQLANSAEIVGVVGDVLIDGPESKVRPLLYAPIAQDSQRLAMSGIVVLKTVGETQPVTRAIAGVAARVDANVPLFAIRTLDQRLALLMGARRFARSTMMVFGGLALVVAILGLYGVLAYGVQARRRELGIRMAIGAAPGTVQRQVLRTGMSQALYGVLIGTVGAWGASKYGIAAIPGLQGIEPTSVALMAASLLVMAALASWVPAYRASRVDPVTTLRAE